MDPLEQATPKKTRRVKKQSKLKQFLNYAGLVLPLAIVLTGVFLHMNNIALPQANRLLSPIPDFLRVSQNSQVKLLDLWSPVVEQSHGSSGHEIDGVTAQSILMYDLTTDKVLFERDAKTRRPMASITKIMTAIVAMENKKSDNKYVVRGADLVGEDSMGLIVGETLSMEELLYGLMLPSGNDAAEVLANNYPAGREAFIQAMNDKAKSMGLVDTQFSNPSGLQGDGIQYTTPYDLVVMTRYALEHFPLFEEIVSSPTHEIAATETHSAYSLVNETNLLTTYPGVKGVKTGFTPEAGMCLVTYLTYDNHKIIGIILNSEDRRGEMKTMLDHSLMSLGIQPPPFEESL